MKTINFKLSNVLSEISLLILVIFIIGFSNSNNVYAQPLKLGQSVVTSFDPIHPSYNCVKVLDLRNRPPYGGLGSGGKFWNPNSYAGADWTQTKMGNVYGIALDDANPPNIFVSRSSVYCGNPDTLVGLIYKIDRLTWAVSNYVVKNTVPGPSVTGVNRMPNTGCGLGNISYDSWHQQLFATNLEDGKIYRIKGVASGIVQSVFDPFTPDAGTVGGFVARGERIWGIGVFGFSSTDVRVYYGRWKSDRSVPGNGLNEIWSVALNSTGDFVAGSARLEITIPKVSYLSYSNPVSDIEFSHTGTMLLGERTMYGDSGVCVANGSWAHQSRIMEYPRNSFGKYDNLIYTQHFVGLLSNTNSAGGVDFNYGYTDSVSKVYSQCDTTIVGTGDYLYNRPGFGLVYGVQYFDKNLTGDPDYSLYIDLNGAYGTGDKTTPGDIDVYRRDSCTCRTTADLWMKDDNLDVGAEPYVRPVFWTSPDIWVSYVAGSLPEKTPEYGQLNYVNVKIRNKSAFPSCGGVMTLQWAKASSAMGWTNPWFGTTFFNTVYPMGGSLIAQTIPDIPAGGSIVVSVPWYPPNPANYSNPSDHSWDPGRFCFLARIETTPTSPFGMFAAETAVLKDNVNKNNNIAMKNVNVYDLVHPIYPIYTSFLIGNAADLAAVKKITFKSPIGTDSLVDFTHITVSARLNDSLYQKWAAGGKQGSNILEMSDSTIKFKRSGAYISGFNLPGNSNYSVGWKIVKSSIPDSSFASEYNYDMIQTDVSTGEIDGGNRITLHPVSGKFLNLNCLIEGFYNTASNTMVPDTVTVLLRNSTAPYSIADSSRTVLNSSGAGTLLFTNAINGTPYYIEIMHRNALETWSSTAVSFAGGTLSYDFTTSLSKAYGSNMVLKGGKACIYSGDPDHSGNCNLADIINVFNAAAAFTTGYVIQDLDGSSFVDLSDIIFVYNNSRNFVTLNRP